MSPPVHPERRAARRIVEGRRRPLPVVGLSAIGAHGLEWRGLFASMESPARGWGPASQLAASHPGTPGGELPVIPPAEDPAEAKARKLMSRGALLAALAARKAMREAGFIDRREAVGFFLGVGASGGAPEELRAMLAASIEIGRFSLQRFGREGLAACNPLFAFQLMNNFTLCHAAILEGTRGPNGSYFSRGGGTVAALLEAARSVADGECECALAGGADSALHPVTFSELRREGSELAPAEGAAILALAARAERPLAWFEGGTLVSGRGKAIASACGEALDRCGAASVDLVLVCGSGKASREVLETAAGRRCPGSRVLEVSGHLAEALAATPALAWAGALDAIAAGKARRVLVLSAGMDGDVGAAVFSAKPGQHATRPGAPRLCADGALGVHGGARVPVITGVGVVSAFGLDAPAFFGGLEKGRGAVGPIRSFDVSSFPTRVAGEVPVVSLGISALVQRLGASASPLLESLDASGALRDRKLAFALLAAAEAWESAGCGAAERLAPLSIALGLEQALLEDFAPIFGDRAIDWSAEPGASLPPVRFRSQLDLAARAIAELLELRGPVLPHASACAAGALAISHAAALVERGAASVVLCGGADSMVNPLGLGGMSRLGAPSPRAAVDACRPFDRRRDGLAIGEGAAMFVVEDEARALARGARPLARVLGWGSTQDAYRATAPRPDGSAARAAMQRALEHARLVPEAVGYINAHGTGTPLNDPAEAKAIRDGLGSHGQRVAVSSIKGAVGHLMSAAGAIEIASCLLAFERDLLPGTANLDQPDPECDLDLIGRKPRPAQAEVLLSNSFGFGGQNACVVLGRPRSGWRR